MNLFACSDFLYNKKRKRRVLAWDDERSRIGVIKKLAEFNVAAAGKIIVFWLAAFWWMEREISRCGSILGIIRIIICDFILATVVIIIVRSFTWRSADSSLCKVLYLNSLFLNMVREVFSGFLTLCGLSLSWSRQSRGRRRTGFSTPKIIALPMISFA